MHKKCTHTFARDAKCSSVADKVARQEAKAQPGGIHACSNVYTSSLLKLGWTDTWWSDEQGSHLGKSGIAASRCHTELDRGGE